MPNPNEFELMDAGVVMSNIDIQESHNHYNNDPECAVDYFLQNIEHDENGKHTNISYQ